MTVPSPREVEPRVAAGPDGDRTTVGETIGRELSPPAAGGRRRIRVASLAHGIGGRESGVRRLVLDQTNAWAAARSDVEVGLFVRCETGTEDAWRSEPNVVAVHASRAGIVGRFVARELLSLKVALWRPDVIYLRHATVSPSLLALAWLYPTIVGGDLDDLDELRIRSRARYWYMRISRELLLRRARRLMVVTNEIAQLPSIARLGRTVDVYPNSIDLASYPLLAPPANKEPHVVFLGAPGLPWAGLDKVARLARALPTWRFDVIGSEPAELGDPPANLVAHGLLTRAEYLPVMARADVALGPLALHRKNLTEASALKVAEYLAYGIPVIVANAETAFPDGAPFLLRIPNAEDNVLASIDEIRAFVEAWKGRRVPRSALRNIDAAVVEPARLDRIVSEARSTLGARSRRSRAPRSATTRR